MPSGWELIEDAIVTEVVSRTGYAASAVTWAHQNVPRVVPGVELAIVSDAPAGPDESRHYWRNDDDANPGAEIAYVVRSVRAFTLECRIRTTETNGNATARAIATKIGMGVSMPSVVDAFDAAGFSTLSVGATSSVPEIRHVDWEGRASVEIKCLTTIEIEEYATYIDFVHVAYKNPPDADVITIVG